MMIPKPFTRITVLGGSPLEVPAGLDRPGIERHAQILQAEMDRLEQKIERIAAGKAQPPVPLKTAA